MNLFKVWIKPKPRTHERVAEIIRTAHEQSVSYWVAPAAGTREVSPRKLVYFEPDDTGVKHSNVDRVEFEPVSVTARVDSIVIAKTRDGEPVMVGSIGEARELWTGDKIFVPAGRMAIGGKLP